jgi:uncharacterized protein (DUF58 family)
VNLEARRALATRNAERAADAARLSTRVRAATVRASKLSPSGLLLAGVVVVAWLLGRVIGGQPLYVLAYGALATLAYAFVASRRVPAVTGARGALATRVVEGSPVDVAVTVTAERRHTTLLLEEQMPPLLGAPVTIPVASVSPEEPAEHIYSVLPLQRGSYVLGPMIVRWGDPFGLTRREAQIAEPIELLVHPAVENVVDRPLTRMWEDPPQRPPISKPWPQGGEFYGMRPYQPGDDVRRVNWRAYARTRELLVQEAEQGITDKVVILLDAGRANHSSGVVSESFESAIRAVASLAVHHISEGYSVTVEGNDATIVPATRSGPGKTLLLDSLARLELDTSSLAVGMSRLVATSRRDAHVLIVTPYLEAEAAARLELLLHRGTQVTVVAMIWDDEHTDTLDRASALGANLVEIRPGTPLAVAFRREVAARR